jgi:hypothetical protein
MITGFAQCQWKGRGAMSGGCDSFTVLIYDCVASSRDSSPHVTEAREGTLMSSGRDPGETGKKGDEEKRAEPGATGEGASNRSHKGKRAREGGQKKEQMM